VRTLQLGDHVRVVFVSRPDSTISDWSWADGNRLFRKRHLGAAIVEEASMGAAT